MVVSKLTSFFLGKITTKNKRMKKGGRRTGIGYFMVLYHKFFSYSTLTKMESLPKEQKLMLLRGLHQTGYNVGAYIKNVTRFRAER